MDKAKSVHSIGAIFKLRRTVTLLNKIAVHYATRIHIYQIYVVVIGVHYTMRSESGAQCRNFKMHTFPHSIYDNRKFSANTS